MARAMKLAGTRTKRETVESALKLDGTGDWKYIHARTQAVPVMGKVRVSLMAALGAVPAAALSVCTWMERVPR